MHRFLRLTSLIALASCGAACSNNPQTIVVVIAPDGGDPFLGADAATQARISLDNDAGTSTTVPVMANGSFQIDVHPASPTEISRLRVEALRNNEVIATGVTAPVQWAAGGYVPVLMQFPDSVTIAPHALPDGRADCQLLELGGSGEFVGCFTFPTAQSQGGVPAVYDVLHQGLATNFEQQVPGDFTGDATVVIAGNKLYLLQGERAVQYIGSAMVEPTAVDVSGYLPIIDTQTHAPARRGLVRSSVYQSTTGGWLLGGSVDGVATDRVDHFTSQTIDDGGTSSSVIVFDGPQMQTSLPPVLMFPRSAPMIVDLLASPSDTAPKFIVAGGNAANHPFLEVYSLQANAMLDLGADTNRTHAAVACVHADANGCDRLIVIGGRNGDSAGDDLLLDIGMPIRHSQAPIVLQRGHWLLHPRNDARLALAEGGRLLVAGGDDPTSGTAVTALEALDVHDPDAAPTSRDLNATSCEHPMVHSLTNGSVIIVGGTRDGAPCTDISFYRH